MNREESHSQEASPPSPYIDHGLSQDYRGRLTFIPEQTSWDAGDIPPFFKPRFELREQRKKNLERDQRDRICQNVDKVVREYIPK
jgi:hypothetical protein